MRTVLLTSIILASCISSHAQITGSVLDTKQNTMPYVNILLLNPGDSSLVKGVVTDLEGKFFIDDVPARNFLLVARMVGYKTKSLQVDQITPNKIITLVLEEESYQLNEVVVRAEKPLFEQRVDRLIVNVENSIVSAGGTVLDVLERSPGITVDRQSGAMSMNGKQGVLVMLNGKLQRLPLNMVVQQLEGITASNVEKIELITNPSARYDAEGDAGIINIVMKKNINHGTHGTATIGIGYGTYSGYWKPIGSFNVNHKRKDVSIFANYSTNRDRRWQQWNYERQVSDPDQYSLTITDRYVHWPIQRANAGVEWSLTNRTTINALVSGFSNLWKMESFNNSQTKQNGSDSAHIKLYDREINHWKHIMTNFNVSHVFREGTKINVDLDYLYYHDNNPNNFINDYYFHKTNTTAQEHVRTSKETPIKMGVFKMDYERQIKSVKVETGIKTTFSRLQNIVKLETLEGENWNADSKFTQNYTLKDDASAAYISVSGKAGSKAQFQLGLRAEHTDMEMSANYEKLFALNFWSVFPTAFYSRQINQKSSWQLSYGRRITRPGYTDVAPFVIFMDPFTYYWGNPRLKPAISDGVQASYSYKDLLLTLRYSYDRNSIARSQSRFDVTDRKTYIFTDNVDVLQLYSFTTSLPVVINTWWKVQYNGLFTYQQTNHVYNGIPLTLEQFSTRLSINQSFSLPHNFTFELTGLYVAPRRVGLSVLKSMGEVSAGVQKKFSNNAKLSVTINDIFWNHKAIFLVNNPLLNQVQQTSYINEPRIVRVSYTFTFGNSNMKSAKQRSTASEAEQQRVN